MVKIYCWIIVCLLNFCFMSCFSLGWRCCTGNEIGFLHWQDSTGWAKKQDHFFNVDNFAKVRGRKACYMSKVCKFCLQKKYKSCIEVFKYSLPNLHKYSLPEIMLNFTIMHILMNFHSAHDEITAIVYTHG